MKILVLTDVQAKPGTDFTFLTRIGQYMVDKRPDVVVCIGDFADMPSLSSFDKGKRSFEGRRYSLDVEASKAAMKAFLAPLREFNERATQQKRQKYRPRMVMTLGNHEERINRAVNDDSKLSGLMSIDNLGYAEEGWEVHEFLKVVVIEGVAFSHYFTTGLMGRPASSAQAQMNKKHMSVVAGHQQGLQFVSGQKADGTLITSIISGSCYEHQEDYLNSQGNNHWRGFLMLNDVKDGSFDPMFVSLKFINEKYKDLKLGSAAPA